MKECSECGKDIPERDSVYRDEKTGEIFCGVCYIKHVEKDIKSIEEEIPEIEPVKKQNWKFIVFLSLGIILIIAEILLLSGTRGGTGPARLPEKKAEEQESGINAARIFFIHELLMNYKAKNGEFPITLSLLTPDFVTPEIKDENIVYEKVENSGFILYGKNPEGEAEEPILSAKGKIEPSRLETILK
jgi:hypothetical protein